MMAQEIKVFSYSIGIPRFEGSILTFTYPKAGPTTLDTELFMVGEGVTYDTGGLDIRTHGRMAGTSRKKCGGAGVIGFLKTAAMLDAATKSNIKINAKIAVSRNNIGSRSFSLDDIILTKNKKRVKVGLTQAMGRLMLAELLNDMLPAVSFAIHSPLLGLCNLNIKV